MFTRKIHTKTQNETIHHKQNCETHANFKPEENSPSADFHWRAKHHKNPSFACFNDKRDPA